jgi:hypothetical protein
LDETWTIFLVQNLLAAGFGKKEEEFDHHLLSQPMMSHFWECPSQGKRIVRQNGETLACLGFADRQS